MNEKKITKMLLTDNYIDWIDYITESALFSSLSPQYYLVLKRRKLNSCDYDAHYETTRKKVDNKINEGKKCQSDGNDIDDV